MQENALQIATESNMTPIEILLQVDKDITVSAKKVYEFLGLHHSNYSQWYKANILENEFAEENVDYIANVVNNAGNGRPGYEFKLTVPFAKKLCMLQRNERGEQARNYFIKVEEKLKAIALKQHLPQLTPSEQLLLMAQNQVALEKRVVANEQKIEEVEGKIIEVGGDIQTALTALDKLQNSPIVFTNQSTGVWKADMDANIKLMARTYKLNLLMFKNKLYKELESAAGVALNNRITRLKNRLKKLGITLKERNTVTKLDVISIDTALRLKFEAIVKKHQAFYAAKEGK